MKILYIGRYNFSEKLTGPEKVAKRIFDISSTRNDAVFLEYFFDGSVYGMWKKLFGYEKVETKIYRIGLFRILNFILKFKPDIIHIITFERFAVIAYLVKIFLKTKIIYNVHGIAVYENKKFKNISSSLSLKDSFAEKIFFRKSYKLLFLSKFQLSIAKQFYKIENTKVQFVTNGIDEEFSGKNNVSISNEKKSLVFIGDSERKDKDFNFLYSSLSKINNTCDLFVIGTYNINKFSNKINNVSIFHVNAMAKTELINFLLDKDIFISSSFYDTFSIAAAECMSLGLVPVVTSNTGISELISDGENGFIVKHDDTNALAEKINLLLEDKNLYKKLSDNARKIYEILNWNRIHSFYEDIYKSELKK
jgi:glycosyltransferase involved in cell wall biosynthesis